MTKANPWSWCCEGNPLSNEHSEKKRNLHDLTDSIQLYYSLLVRYPATHTGKGKKLSGSVFYWVIKKIS